jgi:phosphoribosylaminoimidazole-succinocarboxamide synthase
VSADLDKNEAVVKKATVFGKGAEVIVRYRAVGSFIRRYGDYIESGTAIPTYVEVTLKDDVKGDPLITKDALALLGIMSEESYEELADLAKKIGDVVKDELAKKDLDLYDIKFEFGLIDGKVALIDEISGGKKLFGLCPWTRSMQKGIPYLLCQCSETARCAESRQSKRYT